VPQAAVFEDSCMDRFNIDGRFGSRDVFFVPSNSSSSSDEGVPFTHTPQGSYVDTRDAGTPPLMSPLLAAVQAPLQDPAISAQLSALGLDTKILLAKVGATKAAVDAGSVDRPDAVLESQ
jgi:hypothetical protein